MCVFMGVHILSTVERGNRWVLSDFMRHWQQSLHNQFEPDLAYLAVSITPLSSCYSGLFFFSFKIAQSNADKNIFLI